MTRLAGQKVHPSLLKSWRELRQNQPKLFDCGVRVWGQPVAYMDEIICLWHSELIAKESKQALLSQDLFQGEPTPTVLGAKYCLRQVQHCIGPKVTTHLQLTDTTFA